MNIKFTTPLLSALIFLTACGDNKTTNVEESLTSENQPLSHQDREYQVLNTRIGKLTFENDYLVGVPTKESRDDIFNAIDFQRACQAYIWAVPMVSFYAWKQTFYDMGGEDGQIHYFESYESKLGGLTYNTSTPYVLSFFNVAEQPVLITISNRRSTWSCSQCVASWFISDDGAGSIPHHSKRL